ncbi:MAG: type II toxin-antitoxin system RatA family toxin [Gammaproteobacteria bacterium]
MHVCRKKIVAYSATQMLDIINNIATYPEFLPYCASTQILEEQPSSVKAKMVFKKLGLQYAFSTENKTTYDPESLSKSIKVSLNLLEGPFRHLSGFWQLNTLNTLSSTDTEKAELTEVCFDVDFEFSNKLLQLSFGSIFEHLANTIVDVFLERAKKIYG